MIKTACVVQGNVRRGVDLVLAEMARHFDVVILSTWDDEKDLVPKGDFELILNEKPETPGFSHRNYQRKGTYAGILRAKELGCTHVLKWRTDMLPTKLIVGDLISWSEYDVPAGMQSRLVTCAFRNLSVEPDWYSSIPDLFSFGHIETMMLLWGVHDFDFSKEMNPPVAMLAECGTQWIKEDGRIRSVFYPESELYANFRSRLQKRLGKPLTHLTIVMEYMYLFDHMRLGICWFAAGSGYRPVKAAVFHPWWSERRWRKRNAPRVMPVGDYITPLREYFGFWQERFATRWERLRQMWWYRSYRTRNCI